MAFSKYRFHFGEMVEATTLTGQKIIGKYVGPSNNYGIYVQIKNEQFLCSRLSARRYAPPQPKQPKRFEAGDPVTGLTKKGVKIIGVYQSHADLPYAWIKGFPSTDINEPEKSHKVIRSTIVRIDP